MEKRVEWMDEHTQVNLFVKDKFITLSSRKREKREEARFLSQLPTTVILTGSTVPLFFFSRDLKS
jgi:hypothetical protein